MKNLNILMLQLCLPVLLLLSYSAKTQNIYIKTGASVKVTGAASIVIKDGGLVNDGTYTKGTETVTFSGTAAKIIAGSSNTDIHDLSVSNTGGITTQLNLLTTNELTIASGSKLTVDPAKALTANGATTLGSVQCLVLKSDATGTASFKDNGTISGSGSAKIERFLAKYNIVSDWKFHFLSSPVGITQAIMPEFQTMTNTTDDFYMWNEPAGLWINTKLGIVAPFTWNTDFGADPGAFVTGKGYLVAYPADVTKNFIGIPFTSVGGITMTCTNNTAGGGWNLLGNPFPSAIDWDLVAKGTGMDDALYYYDNSVPRYRYYVELTGGIGNSYSGGARYIPAMQGFMVHAKATGIKTITMDNDDRLHESLTTYYKSDPLTDNVLNIWIEGNSSRDDARVCFYDQATSNFDGEYDAYKLFSYNTTIPELYSITPDNTQLAINTLPLEQMYVSVPVGFMPGAQGDFTFTAEGISSFPPAVNISLEDLKTGTIQKLYDNVSYSFTASTGDNSGRFLLHFQDFTSITNPKTAGDFTISAENGNITILQTQNLSGKATVTDMAGRTIATAILIAGSPTQINMRGNTGVYIVSIVVANGVSNTKIFLK